MNIVDAPKTGTFQMRINPEVLLAEIKAGEDSVKSESDWISEEDMLSEFGVQA